jgi:putative DNA-invertase from lambdoid prophage Rac
MRATLAADDGKIILAQRIVQAEVVFCSRQGGQSRLLGYTQNGFTWHELFLGEKSGIVWPLTNVFRHTVFEQSASCIQKALRATARGGFLARVEPLRVALYARISTHDQQTLPLQVKAMRQYARRRNWKVVKTVEDVGSGAGERPQREELIRAARRRQIDAILVWRLDRWGRSLLDLIGSLQELSTLGVGFVSLCEALDLTTPSGRALAGMLAVFAEFEREILRDRVKAGIAQARQQGKPHGRPPTVKAHSAEIKRLFGRGISKRAIAKRLKIGRTSVRRVLTQKDRRP